MDKYKVVDLFAGAGGLSLGFEQTNKFDIKAAFEKNDNAQKTYLKNFSGVDMRDNVCDADYEKLLKTYDKIDVVIGGPPCQGFSNANRQKNHAINNNNMLVKEYVRAVRELKPDVFVMENVSMLKSSVHRFYLENKDSEEIEKLSIKIHDDHIELIDKKHFFNGAYNLIQDVATIDCNLWTQKDYDLLNKVYKNRKNPEKQKKFFEKNRTQLEKLSKTLKEYECGEPVSKQNKKCSRAINDFFNGEIELKKFVEIIEQCIMVQRMLGKAKEIYEHDIAVEEYSCENGLSAKVKSYSVLEYIKNMLSSEEYDYKIDSGILCAAEFGVPQKRERYVIIGTRKKVEIESLLPKGTIKEENYTTVSDAISDIESLEPFYTVEEDKGIKRRKKEKLSDLAKKLRDSDRIYNHIITKTRETALKRFEELKQGENFHALSEELKTNTYTDASRTQNTIYLRLQYSKPSGTVVNVRKSMWIHPKKDRAISIREAARLQSFPDSFVFEGSKDSQYQQVGNAVPPILANAIAKKVLEILKY